MNKSSPNVTRKEWEEIEVARSASEAAQINTNSLISSEPEVLRYLDPPAETNFPLEYSFHLLGDARGKHVLEYGCGDGLNTVILARRGANVTALDISYDLINVARRRLEINRVSADVKYCVGSAHDLPLADESVDIVFGMAILHHLDLAASSREVYRVLKPGGRAIFQEPIRNSKAMKIIRQMIPYRQPDLSPFERPLTDLELSKYTEKFSSCRTRSFSLPFVNLMEVLNVSGSYYNGAVKIDRTILDNLRFLERYASVKVFELIK
jgi:2-polyprenyl-3-methyl-5-hydroxy-6-metoxy-1,4-benzoquinol methylase